MKKVALATLFAAMISVSHATPIAISFSGTAYTEYATQGFPTIATGTPFSGLITYDTSELASLACCWSYGTSLAASDNVDLQIGPYTFSSAGALTHVNYYEWHIGSTTYEDLNFFNSTGAGWATNIAGLPGPIFGAVTFLGDAGFIGIQPNLPSPNPALFDPALYNLILGGNGLCGTDPGVIDCSAVVDLNTTSLSLVSTPEPNSTALVLVASIPLYLSIRASRRSLLRV